MSLLNLFGFGNRDEAQDDYKKAREIDPKIPLPK
jgi:hypothetical protein